MQTLLELDVKHLTPSDYRHVVWRNGRGSTVEIARSAASPPGAAVAEAVDFAWRLSIATVAASGPFSLFPGCDRWLVQLSGPPLLLTHESGESGDGDRRILAMEEPYFFSGDWATTASFAPPLEAGLDVVSTRDFNCIVDRHWFTSDVVVLPLSRHPSSHLLTPVWALYVLTGRVTAEIGSTAYHLNPGETLLVEASADPTGSVNQDGFSRPLCGYREAELAGVAARILVIALSPRPSPS